MAFRRRQRMSRSKSRRNFTRNAVRIHPKNYAGSSPMRGGYRL